MPLTPALTIHFSATQTLANALGSPSFAPEIRHVVQMADGTGAYQADLLYAAERTVALSSNDDLDLYGVLSSAFNATLNIAKVVGLVIVNRPKLAAAPANLGTLTVGGGTNPFVGFLGGTTPTIKAIGPGGALVLLNPSAGGLGTVTASTADILRIANDAGGSVTYQVAIIGRSL